MNDEMKYIPNGAQIDLTTWGFFDDDDASTHTMRDSLLMKGFANLATKILRKEFANNPPHIFLPFMCGDHDGYGGECPEDPLMLYVSLPLGEDADEAVIYGASLQVAIDGLIKLVQNSQTEKVDDEDEIIMCGKVAARLRQLADKLDSACEATVKENAA